jgi:hypothetical protein
MQFVSVELNYKTCVSYLLRIESFTLYNNNNNNNNNRYYYLYPFTVIRLLKKPRVLSSEQTPTSYCRGLVLNCVVPFVFCYLSIRTAHHSRSPVQIIGAVVIYIYYWRPRYIRHVLKISRFWYCLSSQLDLGWHPKQQQFVGLYLLFWIKMIPISTVLTWNKKSAFRPHNLYICAWWLSE